MNSLFIWIHKKYEFILVTSYSYYIRNGLTSSSIYKPHLPIHNSLPAKSCYGGETP
jgi:hypothetical protein